MKTTYCKNCKAIQALNKYGYCSGCGSASEELRDSYRYPQNPWSPWSVLLLRVFLLVAAWLTFVLAVQGFICPNMTNGELLSRIPQLITLDFETCR